METKGGIRRGGRTDMNKVEDFIQHYGVKGMRWGVRRYQPYPKGEGHRGKFLGKAKRAVGNNVAVQEIKSRIREGKALLSKGNVNKMTTRELQQKTRRLQLENDMKRLTPKVRSVQWTRGGRKRAKKERADYRRRGDMTDQELVRKVKRLRAKDLYNQNANKAGKDVKDAGKRIVNSAVALGASYKAKGGNMSMSDIYDAIATPEHSLVKSSAGLFSGNKQIQDMLKTKLKH